MTGQPDPALTNPTSKNKAVVRACWPLFSLKTAGYWIKHWNLGSFPNASHLLRRTCKAQVLGSGERGLTDSKLAVVRVVSEEMAVGNAFIDMDDNQSGPCSLRKCIHLQMVIFFHCFHVFLLEVSEVSNCKAIWSSKNCCLTVGWLCLCVLGWQVFV